MRDYGRTNEAAYAAAPAVGPAGDSYWDTTLNALFLSNGTAWQAIGGGSAATWIGPSPPASPTVGQLWWRTDPDQTLYVYFDDGNSKQWVAATPTQPFVGVTAGGDLAGAFPNPTLNTVGGMVQQKNAAQSIANNAWNTVTWDTTVFTRGGASLSGSNLTLPSPGVYLILGQVSWTANATGIRLFMILNKAGTALTRYDIPVASSGYFSTQNAQTLYLATDPTDYVYMQAYQNSGAALALSTLAQTGAVNQLAAWRLAT